MAKKVKQTIAILLSVIMLISIFPMTNVFAADIVANGTCGDDLTWTFDSEGTLTITGTGAMYDYDNDSQRPWENYILKTVDIKNGVTSIGKYAFDGCSDLTSVTIGNSVTDIGYNAFNDCCSLANIVLPNSVTSIDDGAFSGCTGLTSITIPDSIKSIGNSAFNSCTGLTNITIPDSVTRIGYYAFYDCKNITDITVDKNNPIYSSADGVLFNKENAELIQYPIGNAKTEYIIPDSVTSIGSAAFAGCTSLTNIIISDSVTSIGDETFRNCTGFTSITIPNSVTSIGGEAFRDCTGLTDVCYTGTQEEWNSINIESGNKYLLNANIRFNYVVCEHDETETVNAKAATAEEEGYTGDLVCKACGEILEKGSVIPVITFKKGDVDGDGQLSVKDARFALRIAAKLESATAEQIAIGDLDGDGKISIAEARKILRVAARIDTF